MKNSLRYILFALISITAACRVGEKYQRADLKLPDQYRGSAAPAADTTNIAAISWKSFFPDPQLSALIEKAVARNMDLRSALKRLEIAGAQLKQARVLNVPELNTSVYAETSRPSKNSLNGLSTNSFLGTNHIETYTANANLSWEADIWGRLSHQKEAALAGYLQSAEAAKAVQTQVVANVVDAYYNLLMFDRQLQIAHRNVALSDSTLRFTQLLRNAGETTTLAVQQASAQKQATEQLIPQLEQNIVLQENALQILTGDYPGGIQRAREVQAFTVPDDPLPGGVPANLLQHRPDVKAGEQAVIRANAQAGSAKANMYPALTITAGTGLASFKASNWFSIPGSVFGLAAGSLVQPVFQRRALKTQYETAKLERDDREIRFKQTVLTAVGEVSDALTELDKLKEQDRIVTGQVDTLNRAVTNARLLFRNGMANYLDVIVAQTSALQSQLNEMTIRKQRYSARVKLYRALGGGWN
ncbi:MAG: efflux transporter outer membrane subunit [Mucilaginibacter polytrichastri]|nr:efflux transporter outer membrane subunit [Mucilaginibacter polytrichastri]